MIIRIVALAAAISALHTAAVAHDVGGRYKSQGRFADGQNFAVTVEIVMKSDGTCRINWSDGVAGICVLKGTKLLTAGIVGGGPQLGVYEVATDGTLEGSFIDHYNGEGFAT